MSGVGGQEYDDDDVTGFPAPDLTTTTNSLNEMLESEEGKHLAEKLKSKMEELSEKYRLMSPEDRGKFEKEFASKFQVSMDKLKRVVQEKVSTTVKAQIYSQIALQIFGVILLISVIG